jgi:hypothetical protein
MVYLVYPSAHSSPLGLAEFTVPCFVLNYSLCFVKKEPYIYARAFNMIADEVS